MTQARPYLLLLALFFVSVPGFAEVVTVQNLRLWQAPDNDAWTLDFTGGLNFAKRHKLTASLSTGSMKADRELIDISTSPYLATSATAPNPLSTIKPPYSSYAARFDTLMLLTAGGKYFLFCNNIDLSKKYQVAMKGALFYVLPIDEATVYNELLELLYLEKTELKKLDTAGKTDRVADAALKFDITFDTITYDEGLTLMGPVRNPNENRPV